MNLKIEGTIYTAVVIDRLNPLSRPWISSFSSMKARNTYIWEAQKRIYHAGKKDQLVVFGDSGALDSSEYLDDMIAPVAATSDAEHWVLTDEGSGRHVLKISDEMFQFIDTLLVVSDPDLYEVYIDIIHLPEYEQDEIEDILKASGYDSIDAVHCQYGAQANQIIAECVFEYYRPEEAEFAGDKAAALAFIDNYGRVEKQRHIRPPQNPIMV